MLSKHFRHVVYYSTVAISNKTSSNTARLVVVPISNIYRMQFIANYRSVGKVVERFRFVRSVKSKQKLQHGNFEKQPKLLIKARRFGLN